MFLHMLGLLLCVASPVICVNSLVETVCPPNVLQNVKNSTYFRVLNNTCFLFDTYSYVTYETARKMCLYSGGSLAMPKTKRINDFLLKQMEQISPLERMWIGMHDLENEGTWMWEDGSKVKSWGNMAFFNDGWFGFVDNCIALDASDGLWHDERCFLVLFPDKKLPYICEYSKIVVRHQHGSGDSSADMNDQGVKIGDGDNLGLTDVNMAGYGNQGPDGTDKGNEDHNNKDKISQEDTVKDKTNQDGVAKDKADQDNVDDKDKPNQDVDDKDQSDKYANVTGC
ncbi:hypothetical protein EGW08_021517 [Elysia chlorotica]|uniref:C-type lectin domain-containing protein n=1 Tax=Elysia chlorotica TaxID=188477 RepID=A0A433SNC8_ELYCH|nr:hypothetical protein EGW08_021517 [Elysia chlorotica]